MKIAAFIGLIIGIIVAINLIAPLTEIVIGILPIVFVAIFFLGAVAHMSGAFENSDTKEIKATIRINRKELIIMLKQASEKLSDYINNLDTVLEIKTINNELTAEGLILNKQNELNIGKAHDWFIVDKHPSLNMFKIVGLHKKDADKNVAYILGKDNENKPYLIQIPQEYIERQTPDWMYKVYTKVDNTQTKTNERCITI